MNIELIKKQIKELDTNNILDDIHVDLRNSAIVFINNEDRAILFYRGLFYRGKGRIITLGKIKNKDFKTFLENNKDKIQQIVKQIKG